jgi:hypothetical protein
MAVHLSIGGGFYERIIFAVKSRRVLKVKSGAKHQS